MRVTRYVANERNFDFVGAAIYWATGSPPKSGITQESQFEPFRPNFFIILLDFELYGNET